MSKLLDLYKSWSKPGKNGASTPIGTTGTFINGKENTAVAGGAATDFFKTTPDLGYEIDGFKTNLTKGDQAGSYPISDSDKLLTARKWETDGTYSDLGFTLADPKNPYSSTIKIE